MTLCHTHGWIRLQGLRIDDARVGVFEHERQRPQPLMIDVALWAALLPAAQSDALADAIDYSAVAAHVLAQVRSRHFALVESLCRTLVESLLRDFPVQRVQVQVHKPWGVASGQVSIALEGEQCSSHAPP